MLKVRAYEGRSAVGLRSISLGAELVPDRALPIPRIARGTRTATLRSVLFGGLSPMNRQTVMLSAFPHWNRKSGHGQRSARDQWSAVVS